MEKAILGKKLGMTQVFAANGLVVPVTVVEAVPNIVTQVKSTDKDGYDAVVVAYGEVRENLVSKPAAGQFSKAGVAPKSTLRELKLSGAKDYSIGQEINCSQFKEGDKVDVIGNSRGRGFTGSIFRWNMKRQPMTHGGNKVHRKHSMGGGGSGVCKVFKGKRMAGRYGGTKVTVQNLEVVRVDTERSLILLKGAVPGPRNSVVTIRNAIKGV
ncbi:MAG: 50S ribosomal protein L3 [Firmicutes bacterium]|nr:50S ribosomal protein L3 [Bacillota bacterium]